MIHVQYLMDSPSGLWYHGWQFDGASGKGQGQGHNFAGALWGRGNCWVTLAIPMFLHLLQLPAHDPTFRHLLATFTRQVDGLLPLQDPETGLWRTLLDDPTSYVETSATAGFVGGILMGVRLVCISPLYRESALISGILEQRKVPSASLKWPQGVYCAGTG
jgi:unsaturated rhamnogalacturonyl hydrolase